MYEGISRQAGTCDMVKYIIHIFIIIVFSGCLICKCSGKFKELNDMHFIVDMTWERIVLKIYLIL